MDIRPLTAHEAKERLYEQGKTLADFAIENGYDPQYVYKVCSGVIKGRNGRGREIMVKLGMKVSQGALT